MATSATKIKAIIHDWDDTVTDSFATYTDWYKHFGDHFGLPDVDMKAVRRGWGNTVPVLINFGWPEISTEKAESMLQEFSKTDHFISREYLPPAFEGVKECIENLSNAGFILGVLSSGKKSQIEKAYRRFIHPELVYHQFIYTQEDSDFHKPDPRVFDKAVTALEDMHITLEETIYVGDSPLDLQAANARGITFVAVTSGLTSKEAFLNAGMDVGLILDKFSDLPYFLCIVDNQ